MANHISTPRKPGEAGAVNPARTVAACDAGSDAGAVSIGVIGS